MALIQGQVESVKESPGKFGPMFGIIVNGTRYGIGKSSQGINQGDWVSFNAEQNARGYWDADAKSIKPITPPAGKTAPVAAAANSTYSADARQDSIIHQSSRKDALEFVALLNATGALEFGKAKGADKVAIVEAYVDKFTDHFIKEVKANKTTPSQQELPASVSSDGPDKQLPF